jgi:hypothetical protein
MSFNPCEDFSESSNILPRIGIQNDQICELIHFNAAQKIGLPQGLGIFDCRSLQSSDRC